MARWMVQSFPHSKQGERALTRLWSRKETALTGRNVTDQSSEDVARRHPLA